MRSENQTNDRNGGASLGGERARRALVGAAAALAVAGVFLAFLSSSGGAPSAIAVVAADGEYKPVAPLDVVMEKVDKCFEALGESTKTKKWKQLGKDSLFLAELMNLAAYYPPEKGDAKEWKSLAGATRGVLMDLAKASKDKNEAGAADLVGKVDAACEACHMKFRD